MSALQPSKTLCLILVAASAALTLSACGSNRQPQTYKNRDLGDAANANVNLLALRAVSVLTPPGGETYLAGADATLVFTIANEGAKADDLVAVRTSAASSVVLAAAVPTAVVPAAGAPTSRPSASPLPGNLAATGSLPGNRAATGSAPISIPAYGVAAGSTALLRGLTKPLRAGNYITVTFVFRHSGSKQIQVPVEVGNSPAPRANVEPSKEAHPE